MRPSLSYPEELSPRPEQGRLKGAEHELRIIMAQSVQAQQQTARELEVLREERKVLAAPKKARWWTPWRR